MCEIPSPHAAELGDLESSSIFLNADILPMAVESDGSLPASFPAGRYISPSGADLIVPALSYGFVVLPDAGVAACAGGGAGAVGGGASPGAGSSGGKGREAVGLQGMTGAGHVAGSTGRRHGPAFATAMFLGAVTSAGLVCWGWQESRNANSWLRQHRGMRFGGQRPAGGIESLPLLVKSRV